MGSRMNTSALNNPGSKKEQQRHRLGSMTMGSGVEFSVQNSAIEATWMQLEIFILKVKYIRKRKTNITYLWNLKYGTNEPIYRMETDSWT